MQGERVEEDITGDDWDAVNLRPSPSILPDGLIVSLRGKTRLLPPLIPKRPLPCLLAFSSKYGLLFVATGDTTVSVFNYAPVEDALAAIEELYIERAAPSDVREALRTCGTPFATFEHAGGAISCIVVSPDSALVFVAGGAAVSVFELAGLKQGAVAHPPCWTATRPTAVIALAVSSRNNAFAVATCDDVAELQVSKPAPVRTHKAVADVRCLEYAPDGELLAIGAGDGSVQADAWTLQAGSAPVVALKWALSSVLLACGEDGDVRIFDLDAGVDYVIREALNPPPRPPAGVGLRFYVHLVDAWSVFVLACSHSQAVGMVGAWSDGGEHGWSRWLVRRPQSMEETLVPDVLDLSLYGAGQRPVLSDDARVFAAGTSLCLCATARVSPYFVLGADKEIDGKPSYPPPPTLLVLSTDGILEAVGLVNADALAHADKGLCAPPVPLPAHAVLTIRAPQQPANQARAMAVAPVPAVLWTPPAPRLQAAPSSLFAASALPPTLPPPPSLAATPRAEAPAAAPTAAATPVSAGGDVQALQARVAALELENSQLKAAQARPAKVPDIVATVVATTPAAASLALPRFTPSKPPAKDATELAQAAYVLLQAFDDALQDLETGAEDVARDDGLVEACAQTRRNCAALEKHVTEDVKDEIVRLSGDVDAFQKNYFQTEWQIEEADQLIYRQTGAAVTPGDEAQLKKLALRLNKLRESALCVRDSVEFRLALVLQPRGVSKRDALLRATAVHQGVRERFKAFQQLAAIVDALEAKQARNAAAAATAAEAVTATDTPAGDEDWYAATGQPQQQQQQQREAVSSSRLAQCLASTRPDVAITPLVAARTAPRKLAGERVATAFQRLAAADAGETSALEAARKESVERLSAIRQQAQRNLDAARTPARALVFADSTVFSPAVAASPLPLATRPGFSRPPPASAPAPAPFSGFGGGSAQAPEPSGAQAETPPRTSAETPPPPPPPSVPAASQPFSQAQPPLPPPPPPLQAMSVEEKRQLVRDFYQAHVSAKTPADVDHLLAQRVGKEDKLLADLQKKYAGVFDSFLASRGAAGKPSAPARDLSLGGFGAALSMGGSPAAMQTPTRPSVAPATSGFGSGGAAFGGSGFGTIGNTSLGGFAAAPSGSGFSAAAAAAAAPASSPAGFASAFQAAAGGAPAFGQSAFGQSAFGSPAMGFGGASPAFGAPLSMPTGGGGFAAFATPAQAAAGGAGGFGAFSGSGASTSVPPASTGAFGQAPGAFGSAAFGAPPSQSSGFPGNDAFTKMRR